MEGSVQTRKEIAQSLDNVAQLSAKGRNKVRSSKRRKPKDLTDNEKTSHKNEEWETSDANLRRDYLRYFSDEVGRDEYRNYFDY
jgi:hypothetical protein